MEQYQSRGNQGPWTDIYALGAVLYCCVSGRKPKDVMDRFTDESLEPPEAGSKFNYSADLLAGIRSALALREEDRPRSIDEWLKGFNMAESEVTRVITPIQEPKADTTRLAAAPTPAPVPTAAIVSPPQPAAQPEPPIQPSSPTDTVVPEASQERAPKWAYAAIPILLVIVATAYWFSPWAPGGPVAVEEDESPRMQAFRRDPANQERMLAELLQEKSREQSQSARLENDIERNNGELEILRKQVRDRAGSLMDMLPGIAQTASRAAEQMAVSPTRAQFPDRDTWVRGFAGKMELGHYVPSVQEMETLWFQLQREATETGKISTFSSRLVTKGGNSVAGKVTRIGGFNLVSTGKYYEIDPDSGRIVELSSQPDSRYRDMALGLENAASGLQPFGIQPLADQLPGPRVP
jgi:hypothetical protein